MQQREQRTAVRLDARIRFADQWRDARIQNVSPHGMLLSSLSPPRPGTYIEIRKATQVIIARAIWVRDQLFGVRTQDLIDIPSLIQGKPPTPRAFDGDRTDRRSVPRHDELAAHSQRIGSAIQALAVGLVAVAMSVWLAHAIYHTLSLPITLTITALQGGP